jgi:fructokinase
MVFPRFVSVGEALTDFIRTDTDRWLSRPGGAPWNVARVVAKLGISSAFAGSVSCDPLGDELYDLSAQAKLDLRFLQRYAASPLLAMVHESSPPKYSFIGSHSADLCFDSTQLPPNWISHVDWIHCGGISLAREPLADQLVSLIESVKRAGRRVSFDPNMRNAMGPAYRPVFNRVAALADLLKVSDEDLRALFKDASDCDAVRQLRALNPRAPILLTRGAQGAELFVAGTSFLQPAPSIQVVDSVGAGDASVGGLLYSLMQHPDKSWHDHLRFGVAAASAACLAPGATPPALDLVEQVLVTMT